MMIKRVYFGNWLRDYSQAVDVGSLKGVQAETIRILVWILAFMSFGYATEEFEVTAERLGVYRPEEHIDNPKVSNDILTDETKLNSNRAMQIMQTRGSAISGFEDLSYPRNWRLIHTQVQS
jgi:hypothetical protein